MDARSLHIETPAVLVNMSRVKENIQDMQKEAERCGCRLRPHIKTHKIPELARLQLEAGARGITCAKVSEAEAMADAGFDDIFIAYPVIGPGKMARIAALSGRVRLRVGVDSLAGAVALSEAAVQNGCAIRVMLEIDTGLARTGVQPYVALKLARELVRLPSLVFDGIYTFKGPVLGGAATTDVAAAAVEERDIMLRTAESLRAEGIAVSEISGGSTPTGKAAMRAGGLTEVRSGTYIFYDMMGVGMKLVDTDHCAARVLATVVSTPTPELAVIDAGAKAISSDCTLGTPPYYFRGYASVAGRPDLVLSRMNEEHGMLRSLDASGAQAPTGLSIGERIELIPNHICTTINLYNFIYLDDGKQLRPTVVALRGLVY